MRQLNVCVYQNKFVNTEYRDSKLMQTENNLLIVITNIPNEECQL